MQRHQVVNWIEDRGEVRTGPIYLGDSSIQKEFTFQGWEDRIDREKKALGHPMGRGEKANKEERRN